MSQFTKYTGTITGQTGSLVTALNSILVTGQGWTAYSGNTSTQAAYQQSAGSGLWLYVDDNAPAVAAEAQVAGFETVSAIPPTDSAHFPLTTELGNSPSGRLMWRKSATSDSTARNYKAWADGRTIIMFFETGDYTNGYSAVYFGDFYSFVPLDGYNCVCTGRTQSNYTSSNYERLTYMGSGSNIISTTSSNLSFAVARSRLGSGGSLAHGIVADRSKGIVGNAAYGIIPYPNSADGGLYLSPMYVYDPTTSPNPSVRGRLRGLWIPAHTQGSFSDGNTVSGTTELSGYTFEFVSGINSQSTEGTLAIETSNTLETN